MKKTVLTLCIASATLFSVTAQNTSPLPTSGNVGIGTTSPLKPLHIEGGYKTQLLVRNIDGNPGGSTIVSESALILQTGKGSSTSFNSANIFNSQGTDKSKGLYFNMNNSLTSPTTEGGTTALFINDVGTKVGLGTSSPTEMLDVNGNLRVQGNTVTDVDFTVGDDLIVGDNITLGGRLHIGDSEFTLDYNQTGLPHASRVMMVRKFDTDQTKRWLFINPRSGGGSGENDFSEGTCLNSRVVITDKRSWWSVPKYASNAVLSVQGSIYSEGIKCQLSGNWADYVFNSNYKLKTLEEVESYIKENNHLPGVPSAEKVETEGLDITDMQRLQMEKIEELTLYMIELKKQNDKLQSQNEEFQERILGLEVANK